MRTQLIAVGLALAALTTAAHAQRAAPNELVDEGACPFECCQYGRWTSTTDIAAFASPGAKRAALTIPARTEVTALTGYVRTVGQPFVVRRPHAAYKPGDTLMVYTYYGEGTFAVWHDGKRFEEDLGFSPYGGSSGSRCTDEHDCWGTLLQELKSEWWVHVRLQDGKTTWVRGGDGFEGQDACR
jgi:hypothetical protein